MVSNESARFKLLKLPSLEDYEYDVSSVRPSSSFFRLDYEYDVSSVNPWLEQIFYELHSKDP